MTAAEAAQMLEIQGPSVRDGEASAGTDGAAREPGRKRKVGLGSITGRLALSNASVALVGIVTGPLQARALGPAGRGELAAILLPFAFLPTLASVGLGSYAMRAVAMGRRPGAALGSMLPLTLAVGLIVSLSSPLVAGLLAGGRAVVYTMVFIGMVTFPLGMLTNMLLDISIGLEDWRPVLAMRLIPPALQLVCIPALFFTGELTVTSAAIVSFAAGGLLLIPAMPVLRQALPLQFSFREMRSGLAYGAKCWLGGLSNIANARLDQLLMIRLVSSSVLGEYAIAVVLSGFFVSPVVQAISTGASARLARDGAVLTRRLCRLTIFGTACAGLCVAAASPLVLHYVFGPAFDPALPMTLILLVATIPNAAGGILNTAVSAHGYPGQPARAEMLALLITVPGLVMALPILGGVGAALVSLVAYGAQFCYMLVAAKRLHGGTYRDYLVTSREDRQVIWSMIATRLPSRKRLATGEA